MVLTDANRELWDKGKAYVKDGIMPDDMSLADIGAVQYFASFNNGGFPRGYAKNSPTRNYFKEGYKSLEAQKDSLKDIIFRAQDYTELDPNTKNAVIYCFDDETEVLTDHGWKLFKDVDIQNDKFLSREPLTKQLAFLRADISVHYPYTGKMYHYNGRSIDFRVTPKHKIFCTKYGKTKKEHFLPVNKFSEKENNYNFVKAGGIWTGTNPETFDLGPQEVDFVDFAYLLGFFLANGWYSSKGAIGITHLTKENQEIVEQLLDKLNMVYSVYPQGEDKEFYLSNRYKDFFARFAGNRHIPTIFKNASIEAISALIDGLLAGRGDPKHRRLFLKSKSLVDDVQECLFKIGKASNYVVTPSLLYIVSVLTTEYPLYYNSDFIEEDWSGDIYCITLEKWHTVLVRRQGKTVWLGQCDPPYQNTTVYNYKTQTRMNYEAFWDWVRKISKDNYVYVSEQQAPDDFKVVWEQIVNRTTSSSNRFTATEHLFTLR